MLDITLLNCRPVYATQPRRNYLVQLLALLTAIAAICFKPVSLGRCSISIEHCYCLGDDIYCRNLGNISQVPSFISSNNTFERLTIDRRTNLRTVQENAFSGIKVEIIVLNGIGITRVERGAFSGLENTLRILDLCNNPIATFPDDVFNGLLSLKELHLTNIGLTQVSLTLFSQLPWLELLHLAYNRFVDIPEDTFNNVKSLKGLYLYSNRLTTLRPAVFRHLIQLETLYLDHNLFNGLPIAVFNSLNESLTRLNLEYNNLTSVSAPLFQHISHLDWLHLGNNRLETINDDAFSGLRKSLRIINLARNRLKYVSSGLFKHFVKLIQIVLESNQITTIADYAFTFTTALKWIHLNENNMTTISPVLFCNLEMLETVYLRENLFVCDCRIGWLRSSKLSKRKILRDIPLCNSPQEIKGTPVTSYVQAPCARVTLETRSLQRTTATTIQTTTQFGHDDYTTFVGRSPKDKQLVNGTTKDINNGKVTPNIDHILMIAFATLSGTLVIGLVLSILVCTNRIKRAKGSTSNIEEDTYTHICPGGRETGPTVYDTIAAPVQT